MSIAYKHEYFELDPESQKVFDENGKELYLTGNAYRMLVFLCERGHAKLLEIGEVLDRAKEYSEEHIRQYRYRINTISGHRVIDYKNNVYSIIGGVKKINRNTSLLQAEGKELRIVNPSKMGLRLYIAPRMTRWGILLQSKIRYINTSFALNHSSHVVHPAQLGPRCPAFAPPKRPSAGEAR